MRILKNKDKILEKNNKFLKYYREISKNNKLQKIINSTKQCIYFFAYDKFSYTSIKKYADSLNFSKVANMQYMFYGCTNLKTIPQLDTGNVTDMSQMFYKCTNLKTIPQLDTSNVTSMNSMFRGCNNLQTIPQLDTNSATDMNYIFSQCYNLQTIDITSLDKIISFYNINQFAYSCNSLTKLIIRNMKKMPPLGTDAFYNCYHFDGTFHSTYNPSGLKDGRIYVPDDKVEELKTATNWSAYADIIVPLSTLVE